MMHDFVVSNVFDVQRCQNLKSELCVPGNMHYVTRTAVNNGVQGLCGNTDFANKGNCIIIGGESAVAFYQNETFAAGNNITALRNENMTELSGLYIVAVLNKFTPLYSYSKAWNTKRVRDTIIALPIIESSDLHHVYTPDDIDWTYMEDHIRRLEEDHIRRLEKYLRVAGFENTILTPEEQEVLRKFRIGGVIFGKYRICDLFRSETGDTDIKRCDLSDCGVPLITSGTANYGIAGLTERNAKIHNAETLTVDMFGNCFYRDFRYKMVTHARVFALIPKEKISREVGLFMASCITKFSKKFSYSDMCSFSKIKNEEISLPCLPSGTPDYALMEVYIRALEKQTVSRLNAMQKEEEKITKVR